MTNAERSYDVYEVVDYKGGMHYTYVAHGLEGLSKIHKLNVRSYRIVEGGKGLEFGAAQTVTWERSNGRELPDLLGEEE